MSSRRIPTLAVLALMAGALASPSPAAEPSGLRVAVRFPASLEKGPLDGRLLLLLSTDPSAEPRFQVSDTSVASSQQVFGIDVDGWTPGQDAVFDAARPRLPRARASPTCRRAPTASRRCSTGTRRFTAPTATS